MPNILKSIRKIILQFSNFWFGITEKTRHRILIIFPLIAGLIITAIMSFAFRIMERYSGSLAYVFIFWFIISSLVMYTFVLMFAILMDERRKTEEQICKDYLTGVYTRKFTYEEAIKMVAQAARSGKIVCVCFVDLDNLKPINDNYSHGAGDEALILVGQTLLDAVRINDLVGRYGGDEFLLIWTTENESTIKDTFSRITEALSHMTFKWHNKKIVITASTGLSYGHCKPKTDAEQRLKELIKKADSVLKRTKKSKR